MAEEDNPLTKDSLYGLLIAIECIQEVLFAHRLTDPAGLIKQYSQAEEIYFQAGKPEIVATLQLLIGRLADPERLSRRALVQGTVAGSA